MGATPGTPLKESRAESILPIQTRAAQILQLENEVSNLVNQAYALTSDDSRLHWETAPPRMPIARPTGI